MTRMEKFVIFQNQDVLPNTNVKTMIHAMETIWGMTICGLGLIYKQII
jgi:hypothetical protein